jgi:hypothetical protein
MPTENQAHTRNQVSESGHTTTAPTRSVDSRLRATEPQTVPKKGEVGKVSSAHASKVPCGSSLQTPHGFGQAVMKLMV